MLTVTELRHDLTRSGKLNATLIDKFLAYCADATWWTETIAFTASSSRAYWVKTHLHPYVPVVILRRSSNFRRATVSGVYVN
jgi:hypothetical protein